MCWSLTSLGWAALRDFNPHETSYRSDNYYYVNTMTTKNTLLPLLPWIRENCKNNPELKQFILDQTRDLLFDKVSCDEFVMSLLPFYNRAQIGNDPKWKPIYNWTICIPDAESNTTTMYDFATSSWQSRSNLQLSATFGFFERPRPCSQLDGAQDRTGNDLTKLQRSWASGMVGF
jgi:hypothetical protein